jgi:cell division septation protein DedD
MAREARSGLGLADRLVLLVAWITTCGLVYLLGFYVGKGTQERRLGIEERVVRLPVTSTPPPEGQRPKAESEFGFYGTLMGEQAGTKGREAVKVSPPAPPARPAPTPAPPAVAASPAPGVVASKSTTAPPPRPPHTTADAEKPPPGKPPAAVPASPSAPPPVVAKPAPVPPAAPPVNVAAVPAPGGWTVLANPTRNRDEADGLTKQLRGKGYDATLVRVLRDGDTWYRVQVGRFTTSDQATELMHRLREREGVEHAFVASE